jgi:hypothetical protein
MFKEIATLGFGFHNSIIEISRLRNKRAMKSSALYIEEHGASTMIFRSLSDFWSFAIDQVSIKGLYVEFGVSYGKSIKYFANIIPEDEKIFGFDSFQGLRENFFGTAFTKGKFSTGG